MPASFSQETLSHDKLIAGPTALVQSRKITLITGQNLVRGAVLGKITASGKYNLSLSAAVDGSQTPDAILAEDTNATSGDKVTVAYFRGDFAESALTIGTAHTADTIREGLRGKGITLVKSQGA
jgi:hypothetical protein